MPGLLPVQYDEVVNPPLISIEMDADETPGSHIQYRPDIAMPRSILYLPSFNVSKGKSTVSVISPWFSAT